MNKKFSFIDLFAGIGGFRIALTNSGGSCVNFSEINADAINTYCTNFNESTAQNLGDITKIKELPKHDLLVGGVPCQSWSIAGRNLGFDDDRGQLWNDTIYLLNKSKPKAFIFENVKGLVDPRNADALSYILDRIKQAGYHAQYFVLNSFDYGVPQNRVRIYIIGFRNKKHFDRFNILEPINKKTLLRDVLDGCKSFEVSTDAYSNRDLFGNIIKPNKSMSMSNNNGFNDYFLFNDIRNGHTTVHSWEILKTTERQKKICLLLLQNRRKSIYGKLDGNPLSIEQLHELDKTITKSDIDDLVKINILKPEQYSFTINNTNPVGLTEEEVFLLSLNDGNNLVADNLLTKREIKIRNISVLKTLESLIAKEKIKCNEIRYDFRFTKISTGLFGINRIFLPSSNIFSTLVASDTNDYVTTVDIQSENENDYKQQFIRDIYNTGNYRKITQKEACRIQGFPDCFVLPESRAKWMKLIGNSVSVPVVEMLCRCICNTGVFENE